MSLPGVLSDSTYRPPLRLAPGELVLRTYYSDLEASRKIARFYGTVAVIPAVGLVALGVILLYLAAAARVADPVGAVVLGIGIFVGVVPRMVALVSEPHDRELPDVVYLTSQRVIVDEGLAWESTKAIPLAIVSDVILWQSWAMVRAGIAWVYLMPLGATRVDVIDRSERMPAPGVIEIQNLAVADAQALRREVLGLAQSGVAPPRFSPPPAARSAA